MAKYIVGFLLMTLLIANVQSAQYGCKYFLDYFFFRFNFKLMFIKLFDIATGMTPSGDRTEKENATIEIYCTKDKPDFTMDSLIFNISSSKPMPPSELEKYFEVNSN